MGKRVALTWSLGHTDGPNDTPDFLVPAEVPGAVQLCWGRAENLPDPHIGKGYEAYGWMEDKYWHYIATLPKKPEGDRQYFMLEGVDYAFSVWIEDKLIHEQEGMFTPARLDITDCYLPGAQLHVIVNPAPKRKGAPVGRDQADHSAKPAVSYGWDWHPRFIPLGLWRPAYLEGVPETHILDYEARAAVSDDLKLATVTLSVKLSSPGTLVWKVRSPEGFMREVTLDEPKAEHEATITLEKPTLWWPNGHGNAALYTSEVTVVEGATVLDKRTSRLGVRRLRLVMHEGAWKWPDSFPKTRTNPPITVEVNNRRIFCKGSNWVAPDICPSTTTAERYREHVQLAKNANMNLLRIWGGGIALPDEFYDACDELGVLVWQEFPLSCNNYPDDADYLRVLDRESHSIIKRLRHRASLALWCGGNELFNAWSGMTDQSLPLRLLNSNCYLLDPQRPFLPTSPLMGMAHGCYTFRYPDGREVFQVMPSARATAYTEFGVPAPADVETLRSIIPESELWPPKPGGVYEAHHGFNAWEKDTWLCLPTLEHYFGELESLEQMVELGQWLQCEGYRCIFEEARRQKPVCSMAVNWCFQEPWPTAANNSLIAYPSKTRPAYHSVAAACRPKCASARIPRFQWKAGEDFSAELWLLNDTAEAIPAGVMEAYVTVAGKQQFAVSWRHGGAEPNTNLRGPSFVAPLIVAKETERFSLRIRYMGCPDMDAEYTLSYKIDE